MTERAQKADFRRKPQIGLRHLRCVTFSSALLRVGLGVAHWSSLNFLDLRPKSISPTSGQIGTKIVVDADDVLPSAQPSCMPCISQWHFSHSKMHFWVSGLCMGVGEIQQSPTPSFPTHLSSPGPVLGTCNPIKHWPFAAA